MTAVAAVIVDLGNTLVDYPLADEAAQLAFVTEFLRSSPVDAVPRDVLDRPEFDAALREFNAEAPDSRVTPLRTRLPVLFGTGATSKGAARLERSLCDAVFASGAPVCGAAETLQELRRRDVRLAIASNTPWGTSATLWRKEVRRLGLDHDVLAFCGDVGWRKPHPALLLHCCARLGVAPHATLVVGDSLVSDVAGGRRAGCQVAWFDRTGRAPENDTPTITSLAELACDSRLVH